MARRPSRKKSGKKKPRKDRSLPEQLHGYIAEGRGHRAVAIAKKLEKKDDLAAEHLPLIVSAYRLRAWEMLANGHGREAGEMLGALVRRMPDAAGELDPRLQVNLDCFRESAELLNRWGADTETDAVITEAIRSALRDLRHLADAEALPPKHALRQEAQSLVNAWEAIEAGEPAPDLSDISRRSPLVHWRLFLQALAAFYCGDDDTVAENLKRIPQDSAVQPLAATMTAIISTVRSGFLPPPPPPPPPWGKETKITTSDAPISRTGQSARSTGSPLRRQIVGRSNSSMPCASSQARMVVPAATGRTSRPRSGQNGLRSMTTTAVMICLRPSVGKGR